MVGSQPGAEYDPDIAFTPIAMPSLAGPGSFSVVLTAASQIRGIHPEQYAARLRRRRDRNGGDRVLRLRDASSGQLDGTGPWTFGIDAMTRIFGFLLVASACSSCSRASAISLICATSEDPR